MVGGFFVFRFVEFITARVNNGLFEKGTELYAPLPPCASSLRRAQTDSFVRSFVSEESNLEWNLSCGRRPTIKVVNTA